MVLLTTGIALWMLKLRYKAVRQQGVSLSYFRLNRGGKLPEQLMRVTQHYENLFETPILFYVAILFVLVLNVNDMVYIAFSWLFFVSRLVHAYVHTIHNNVLTRKNVFIVSSMFLLLIWLKLMFDVIVDLS